MTSQLYDVATGNIDQAADHNQAIDALNILLGFTTSVTVNGPTSGTATLYEPLQGQLKMVIVVLTNYRNGPAGDQNLVLPVAFTHGAQGWNGSSGKFDLKSAGASQTVQINTGFASATVDGTVTGSTEVTQNNQWHCDTPFDTIGLWGSDAGTHNGFIFIIGS
jgi:hypothetical protein